jgi:RimJ/RimL family protein N-acetyltransferase
VADAARDNEPGLTQDALPPLIESRRLCLCPPKAGDIAAISRLINHPEIALNLSTVRYPYPPISAWGWLASARRVQDGTFHRPYLLHLRANPRLFAGVIGVTARPDSPPEIGYWLGRPYRRRGYASEAARALISAIFANSGVAAVSARAQTRNIASQRVLEASGMRRVGRGRVKSVQLGRYVPVLIYRLERDAWAQSWSGMRKVAPTFPLASPL